MPPFKPKPGVTHECFYCKNTRFENQMLNLTLFRERRWVCNWKFINDCNSPDPEFRSYQ